MTCWPARPVQGVGRKHHPQSSFPDHEGALLQPYYLFKLIIGAPAQGSGLNGVLDDPNKLAPALNSYINGFSPNVRAIMERFKIGELITFMAEKELLYLVIKAFAAINLSPERVDEMQMGYVFEELMRIGPEQSNEEVGEYASGSSNRI